MIAGIVASMLRRRASPPGELESLLPNRLLGVLFYQGEKHPGGGGDLSDTEWAVVPGDAIQQPSGDPYPGITGQFNMDLGPFILEGGDGPIETLSGFYIHWLLQSDVVFQAVFSTDQLVVQGVPLDPTKQDAFNAFWDAGGNKQLELLDETDAVVAVVPMTASTTDPTNPADPTQPRSGYNFEVPGPFVKMRLVPVP